jgi:FG-GAP repeat protein
VNGNQSDNSATSAGAAYVFVRSGTTWTQQAYLKASNTEANDFFGFSVAVSGDTVVVGAPREASNATGVNGNQSDNSATSAGAAYVFVRSGTTWSQQAYLKASNTETGDDFGFSVAVSGDTIVVGAWGEDSNATGVNGNQNDNSLGQAGAAYTFTGLHSGPLLALVPDNRGGFIVQFNGVPGSTYRLQSAPSAAGPWTTIATITSPPSGLIEYDDLTPSPGQAFYRTVHP